MLDRATLAMESIDNVLSAAPQTFLIDTDPTTSESPIYQNTDGRAVGLSRVVRGSDICDFCNPPLGHRDESGVYITNGSACPADVHPGIVDTSGYRIASGGVLIMLDGVEVIQPKYNLLELQSYLVGNAWHYAAVKAKATAATELGYEWHFARKSQAGIVSQATKALSAFEERVYTRNHKDLSTILKDQAMDYFSCGNKTLEIAYNMGGTVDCIFSVPAVTVFRHPEYPVAVQAVPEWESWSPLIPFENNRRSAGMQIKAILPLYMSGLYVEDLARLFPNVDPTLFTNNELVHVANTLISTDPFYGVADILPALSAMFGDNAANDYNWQFFQNNAVPRYAVTIAGGRVTNEVKQMVVDFFNREIQGRAHRTIVIPLPRDMTANFQALDATPNDMSFVNYKKLNREEIAAVHSIPPSEIGLWENANKANANQQAKNYFLKVIRPYQAKDEAMMNRILHYGLGLSDVTFKFKNVEYTDDQERATVQYTKAQAYKQYLDGIANVIKTIQGLANGQAAGGGSGGSGGGWWGRQAAGDSGSGGSSGGGGTTAPKPVQVPLLSKEDAKARVKDLLDQIAEGRYLFELEDTMAQEYE